MLEKKVTQVILVFIAGLSVAVADALIKSEIQETEALLKSLRSPVFLVVYTLYFFQIWFFSYVFLHQWKLGIVGILQMVAYTLAILIMGQFLFHEHLNKVQYFGIGLALIAIVLMNWE